MSEGPHRLDEWLFDSGIRQIHEAYRESEAVFITKQKSLLDWLTELQRRKEPVPAVMAALDPETTAQYQIEQTEETIQVIRQTFLVALYHHWERSMLRWQGSTNGRFKESPATWLAANSLPYDAEGMEDYRLLMKVIKHETGGDALITRRPDLFPNGSHKLDDLHLSTAAVKRFFETIRGSGHQWKLQYVSW